jgi:DNA-binding protein Fis
LRIHEGRLGERDSVVDALARSAGNQTQAARYLGVSRRTLVKRLEEFALPRPRKQLP